MMNSAKRGDWVRIHTTILEVGERAPQIPEETRAVPLDMWVNGFLVQAEAGLGQEATVRTLAGRELTGVLSDLCPVYAIDYGKPQPELLAIGPELRALLKEGKNHA